MIEVVLKERNIPQAISKLKGVFPTRVWDYYNNMIVSAEQTVFGCKLVFKPGGQSTKASIGYIELRETLVKEKSNPFSQIVSIRTGERSV